MTVYRPVGGGDINDKCHHAHTGVYAEAVGKRGRWGNTMIERRRVKFDVDRAWDARERTNEMEGEDR